MYGDLLTAFFVQILLGFAFVVVAVVVIIIIIYGFSFIIGFWLEVFLVEVIEQEVEENGIWHGEPHGPSWIAAIAPQQLSIVQECHTKLDLQCGGVIIALNDKIDRDEKIKKTEVEENGQIKKKYV